MQQRDPPETVAAIAQRGSVQQHCPERLDIAGRCCQTAHAPAMARNTMTRNRAARIEYIPLAFGAVPGFVPSLESHAGPFAPPVEHNQNK